MESSKAVQTLTEVQSTLRHHMAWLKQRYGIQEMGVFGSFARNEATADSDVDLLVSFSKPIGLFGFYGLEDKLAELMGRKVDLVTPRALKPQIRQGVYQDLVAI